MSIQRYLMGSGYASGSQTFSGTGTFTAPQGVYSDTDSVLGWWCIPYLGYAGSGARGQVVIS